MPSCLTDYELVTQSVDLTSGTPSSIVDLAVPSGKIVLGSGIVVTHVWHSGALTAIASVSDWGPTEARDLHTYSGPHPSDSTKWRFELTSQAGAYGEESDSIRVLIWLTAANA